MGSVSADLHSVFYVNFRGFGPLPPPPYFTQGWSHLSKITRTCLEALLLPPGPFVIFNFFLAP